jgi:hypothetical protein
MFALALSQEKGTDGRLGPAGPPAESPRKWSQSGGPLATMDGKRGGSLVGDPVISVHSNVGSKLSLRPPPDPPRSLPFFRPLPRKVQGKPLAIRGEGLHCGKSPLFEGHDRSTFHGGEPSDGEVTERDRGTGSGSRLWTRRLFGLVYPSANQGESEEDWQPTHRNTRSTSYRLSALANGMRILDTPGGTRRIG